MARNSEDLFHDETAVSAHHMARLWHINYAMSTVLDMLDADAWTRDTPNPLLTDNQRAGLLSALRVCAEDLSWINEHYQISGKGRRVTATEAPGKRTKAREVSHG